MNKLEQYQIYKSVNQSRTLEELAIVIKTLCNASRGMGGQLAGYDMEAVSEICKNLDKDSDLKKFEYLPTRWGIKQQAMYLVSCL